MAYGRKSSLRLLKGVRFIIKIFPLITAAFVAVLFSILSNNKGILTKKELNKRLPFLDSLLLTVYPKDHS
jgi:hypothetical protein